MDPPCTGKVQYSTVQYITVQCSTVQHNGFPVYRSSSGLFLYKHTNDKWRANSVVNERGVLRGTLTFLELGNARSIYNKFGLLHEFAFRHLLAV